MKNSSNICTVHRPFILFPKSITEVSVGLNLMDEWMEMQESDHVSRMARFALRCVSAASETLIDENDPSGGYVVIRAGFHTGPVVANVVGTKYRSVSIYITSMRINNRLQTIAGSSLFLVTQSTQQAEW